jgi:hypothetical protein
MASLIPEIDAFQQSQQFGMRQQMGQMQQLSELQKIMAVQAATQQREGALMREKQLRGALSQLGPDATPEQVIQAVRPYAGADDLLKFELAMRKPVEKKQNPSNLTRLMEERDALPANDPRRKHYDNAIRKESETAKQISPTVVMPRPEQPLVSVVGPDGKPKLVRREDAIGMMPWAAGSAQDKKQETVDSGRESVNSMIATLRDQYTQLLQGGGITDPDAGPVDNIKAGISSSGLGQFVGRAVGTRNQSARNQIAQQRPLLLNAIKQATGMSAKQMDSNAELKLYLSAATDPTLDIRANMAALDKLDELYGLGLKKPSDGGGGGLPDASAIDAELARRRKKK